MPEAVTSVFCPRDCKLEYELVTKIPASEGIQCNCVAELFSSCDTTQSE